MRVLMTSWGSRGDVEPLAALALRLTELGAEVRLAVPPDEDFVDLADRVGATLIPFGPTVHSIVAADRPPSAQDAFQLAAALVAARFETLPGAAEGCDVILATGLMPAGVRDVADKLGIRYELAAFQVYGLPSKVFKPGGRPGKQSSPDETDLDVLWQEDADRVYELYGRPLNEHRAAIGLPPVANVRDYVFGDRPLLAADPVLCSWADTTRVEVVQTGAWILPDERPLPDGLTAFLDAGPQPVYVGFGSIGMHAAPDVARVVVESVRAHGRRLVLARGWAELAKIDDGDDCFVVGEVNQQLLFRRVAAVAHHGGAGTTTTAGLAGVPQLVIPQYADQPIWAARVAELGIGVAHAGPAPTVESFSAALDSVLAPAVRERAGAVAGRMTTDGATVAAKLLLGPNA
ncbi:glycosyltransferase [Hamadaea tsunoensis]|uniref:glycosyltransferase n=1 Tax=Hamadaea tsunoensis TaxID=53368 RepID=UPI00047F4843|nr:glycosyltransferase [Hamadaea tsunoensis]